MGTLFTFPSTQLSIGVTTIPQTAITGYTESLSCLLIPLATDAVSWATAVLVIALELSYDGGVTFLPGGSSGHGSDSTVASRPQLGLIVSVSEDVNGNVITVPTHVRGTLTVSNHAITVSCTVSVA